MTTGSRVLPAPGARERADARPDRRGRDASRLLRGLEQGDHGHGGPGASAAGLRSTTASNTDRPRLVGARRVRATKPRRAADRAAGSFAAGATVVTSPGVFDATALPATPAGRTLHGDHAYAFYQVPVNARRLPLVMWHGIGQFSKTWETTPGWSRGVPEQPAGAGARHGGTRPHDRSGLRGRAGGRDATGVRLLQHRYGNRTLIQPADRLLAFPDVWKPKDSRGGKECDWNCGGRRRASVAL